MASNLSTIGFVFAGEGEFRDAMIACAAQAADAVPCPAGHYGVWRSRTGAEVWFHLARTDRGETEIFGLTPFFSGKSEVPLRLTRALSREGDNPFEGAIEGFVTAAGDGGGDGYPIVFEAVDFALTAAGDFPRVQTLRISAFARDLKAYADEAAFYAAHEGSEGPKFAAKAYIPVGLFAGDMDTGEPAPEITPSVAFITGTVLESHRLTNEATGRDFLWLVVETLDATLDVIADPVIVSGDPEVGACVELSAAIFGRVVG